MNGKKTEIIAELGVNHNGNISLCKEMISMAKECGADSVKIQMVTPELISNNDWLIDVQKKTSLSVDEILEAKEYAQKIGIPIFSSIGDIGVFQDFKDIGFERVKLSSSNLNNWQLHHKIPQMNIPVIASTGDGKLEEVVAMSHYYITNVQDFTLMHCISNYPAKEEDANLNIIPFYKNLFNCKVGFSDHNPKNFISFLAATNGASIIEKHITLNRKMKGPDHQFSLDESGLRDLVDGIERVNLIKGNIKTYFKQLSAKDSLVRRTLVCKKKLEIGEKITEDILIIARPNFYTEDSINPKDYTRVIGSTLKHDLNRFDPLCYYHIT